MSQTNDKYFVWFKGCELQLTPHFSTRELECNCDFSDCQEQRISKELLERLGEVRRALGSAIYFTNGSSAFRCRKKQAQLRKELPPGHTAKNQSQHELGNAADVYTTGNMNKLGRLLEDEFNAIGYAKTFYHVDIRDDKERRWKY